VSTKEPVRTPTTYHELETIVGKSEDVLGVIPKPDELKKQLDDIEKEIKKEEEETEAIAQHIPTSKSE
jgi:hypothetical protein